MWRHQPQIEDDGPRLPSQNRAEQQQSTLSAEEPGEKSSGRGEAGEVWGLAALGKQRRLRAATASGNSDTTSPQDDGREGKGQVASLMTIGLAWHRLAVYRMGMCR